MNKRGGIFGKLLFVLLLMIASAVAGAYGYYILDGQMATEEAIKLMEEINIEDYDQTDATKIEDYIDITTKHLEEVKSRKKVYEIMTDFKEKVAKFQTSNEKELAAAKEAAEKAKQEAEEAKQRAAEQEENEFGSENNSTKKSGTIKSGEDNQSSNNKTLDKLTKVFDFGN